MYQAFCEDPAFHNSIQVLSVSVCVCMVNITTFNEEGKEKEENRTSCKFNSQCLQVHFIQFWESGLTAFQVTYPPKGKGKRGAKKLNQLTFPRKKKFKRRKGRCN